MPLGAIVGPAELMDSLAPEGRVYQAGTLSGNALSMAAGLASLRELRDQDPYTKLDALGQHFVSALVDSGIPHARAQRAGAIVWLHLATGELPRSPDSISLEAMERYVTHYWALLRRGHHLPPSSYEVMFCSTQHTTPQIEKLAGDLTALLGGTPE